MAFFHPIFWTKKIGRNWNLDKPTGSHASMLHFDFQTKAILWLSFHPIFWTKNLAGTGIWINPPVRTQACFTSIFRRKPYYGFLSIQFFGQKIWPELESNQRHKDFQSSALPTELSGQKII
jgi:hypothetical protein